MSLSLVRQRVSKDRTPTEDEKQQWEEAMAETIALKKPNRVIDPLKKRPKVKERYYKPQDLPQRLPERIDPLERQIPRHRLKKVNIEARVDLHGMTQDQAYRELQRFLTFCQQKQMIWVLVITGKGIKKEEAGVLRTAVPQWLSQPPFISLASGYAPAKDKDGGLGALYVRLKRL